MIWKSVRDTKQQNKSHNAKVALGFSRLSDSGVRREFREQEKNQRGRTREGGKACGISFKQVILSILSGTSFFQLVI